MGLDSFYFGIIGLAILKDACIPVHLSCRSSWGETDEPGCSSGDTFVQLNYADECQVHN